MALTLDKTPMPQMAPSRGLADALKQGQQLYYYGPSQRSMINLRQSQAERNLNYSNPAFGNDAGMPPLARLWHRISTIQSDPNLANDPNMQDELAGYKDLYSNLMQQLKTQTFRNYKLGATQDYRSLPGATKSLIDQQTAAGGAYPSASTPVVGSKVGGGPSVKAPGNSVLPKGLTEEIIQENMNEYGVSRQEVIDRYNQTKKGAI